MSDDPRYSQQHIPPMESLGKGMQGQHGSNIHPGMGGTGQQGMPQGPSMTGMSPSHQMMQGGPGPNIGPGGPSSSMGGNHGNMGGHMQNNMVGHSQSGMGAHGPQGMSMNASASNMPPTSMGGMPNMQGLPDNPMVSSSMANMTASNGSMPVPNHSQQQHAMGPGQMSGPGMVGPGPVQSMTQAMSGGSSSPNLSGSQMAGGAMGPPNQSVDPSTSQSK